ncbi:hypothetical protein BKA70DRAFT_792427 [Coprinopsis sp. MPI-PUGE-AT-0042]|nr:hypothetical protein BKA70DRAFT_792427 [Coprinopsis sp. MPI-PUGE-AT-0042]
MTMEDDEDEQADVDAMDQDLVPSDEGDSVEILESAIDVDEEMKPASQVGRAGKQRRVEASSDIEVQEIETDTSEAAASPRESPASPRWNMGSTGTTGASSSVLRHGVASTASGSRQRSSRSTAPSNPFRTRSGAPGPSSTGPSTLPQVEETPTRPRIRTHARRR